MTVRGTTRVTTRVTIKFAARVRGFRCRIPGLGFRRFGLRAQVNGLRPTGSKHHGHVEPIPTL